MNREGKDTQTTEATAAGLLATLRRQAEEIDAPDADLAGMREDIARSLARLAVAVEANGPDAAAAATVDSLRTACRRLMDAAERRRRDLAAEMAAMRRGRMGLRRYHPGRGGRNALVRISV